MINNCFIIILIICMIILMCFFIKLLPQTKRLIFGGSPQKKIDNNHIIVDTLNLTHWFYPQSKNVHLDMIISVINNTAEELKKKHSGRVIYVIKDKESTFNTDNFRQQLHECAKKNKIFISITEKYKDPPSSNTELKDCHSKLGRDDFYMSILANQYKCKVLTADMLRDFSEFRFSVPPFYVLLYSPHKDLADNEYIRPESIAYRFLRRPMLIHPDAYFIRK